MHRLMNELKDLVLCDVEDVVKKGEIAPADYEKLGEAVDILKDIETIVAMEEYGYEDRGDDMNVSGLYMPRYNSRMMSGNYRNNSSGGTSYERGRSPRTGRYVSRDTDPMQKLSDMMATAQTDAERATIQRMMDELGR